MQDCCDPKLYLGYQFEKKISECKFTEQEEREIREKCINFVVKVLE